MLLQRQVLKVFCKVSAYKTSAARRLSLRIYPSLELRQADLNIRHEVEVVGALKVYELPADNTNDFRKSDTLE